MAKTDFLSAHFLYEKKNHEKRLQNCNQRWYPALRELRISIELILAKQRAKLRINVPSGKFIGAFPGENFSHNLYEFLYELEHFSEIL